ncbi:E3 ubiquitin-protein ligase SH3RF1 [Syngnathoides biaculeatus]|uniref:E3 ubiquitin-protein ligase SH3RF1 n=1 Tax=Syngnathoides biaculeatus TaxID=300417 RepID=UPI002ADD6446|nr:E3 ubiquitin-protein ligase SH3RF1 [Syngnathoides biaculeatus]XP_061689989.1 E3 ubiquitin-protein ligase SH3RF1 [Syngnathoides biaculeatus]XP_061689990.1 E3 ubiquitin-protein ligase SH3RF1 [Syngnathoides biaculeatus]
MEALSLMDLLECPLCSEQLDASAKVLPCQHTFCKACLQKQEAAHSQLICPECRTPARARTVDELPANILLVRLLDGLQGSAGASRNSHYAVPFARSSQTVREGHYKAHQGHKEVSSRTSIHNQQGDSEGELTLSLVTGIVPKHRATPNEDWVHRHISDNIGTSVSAGMPHAAPQTPLSLPHQQSPALCRTLCDFSPNEMNAETSDACLSFRKGDILTVIRRVDEYWIEAKLGDRIGICPLQFTELNSVATKLVEGKSPRRSDSAEFPNRTGSRSKEKGPEGSNKTANHRVTPIPAKTPLTNPVAPSNPRKQPSPSSSNFSVDPKISGFNFKRESHRSSVRPRAREHAHPSRNNSQRVRRHSDGPHRHLLLSEKMAKEAPPNISMALSNPQISSSSADSKNSNTQQLSISVCAVLYSYKPQRPEELELRKGEMVGVYGKFKEGWLRGLSLRTGKVGILPSNYITPVLRTSARLLETKAANASSQHNPAAAKKHTAARSPAVVLSPDRVNTDGALYSAGQASHVPNGAQHAMSSTGAGKSSFYGTSPGWETVRRLFNSHRASNHSSTLNVTSNSEHFAQVQASGYSPAMQRKKSSGILANSRRPGGWMSEPTVLSGVLPSKDREFTPSHEARCYQPERHLSSGPHSILVRPDSHKSTADKPAKSVRFLTDEDTLPPRLRTSSWSSGSQVPSNFAPAPPPLEVWAPSLTLGRDGPGILLKDGKAPTVRKGMETVLSDLNSNSQKTMSLQSSMSAVSAQFSPTRHRVTSTHLAQTDSELSLLQGELVLVHRPRPDGRLLVTQETSGQTGLFHCSILHALERLT